MAPFFIPGKNPKHTPFQVAAGVLMAIVGIYYGNFILSAIMEIAQMPYYAMLYADATSWDSWTFVSTERLVSQVAYQISMPLRQLHPLRP